MPETAAALGVACVTCHVLGRDIVGASRERSVALAMSNATSPHPVVRDGRLERGRSLT